MGGVRGFFLSEQPLVEAIRLALASDTAYRLHLNKVVLWPLGRELLTPENDNVVPSKSWGTCGGMPMDRTGGETDDLSLSLCLI